MVSEIGYRQPRLGDVKGVICRVGGMAEIPPGSRGNLGPSFATQRDPVRQTLVAAKGGPILITSPPLGGEAKMESEIGYT